MEEQKDRINNILMQVLEGHKDIMETLEHKGKEIDKRLSIMQKIVYDHVRKQCQKEFKWIENNGKVIRSDQGFRVQVNSNAGIEADAKVREFSACVARNDFGFKHYFEELQGKQNMIQSSLDHCIAKCLGNSKDVPDSALKVCIKDCVEISLNKTKTNFEHIEYEIDSVKNKLL